MRITRRLTVTEGLFSGLGSGTGVSGQQLAAKVKLLVEAPAAVEDALASLLDASDSQLQASTPCLHTRDFCWLSPSSALGKRPPACCGPTRPCWHLQQSRHAYCSAETR